MEAKSKPKAEEVPTLSIKDGAIDSLDELLADFSEFVRQEDKVGYDNQVKLRTKAPNPLRMSPKMKSPHALPTSFSTIQTPLPLAQPFKLNHEILLNNHNQSVQQVIP